ncbi:MAG: acyltransferase [Betaproteobacteria bacterium]
MNRISGLDLLRAIAIVWVMLFHSYIVGGLGTSFDWLSRYGWAGVDMFFVLSGFLIGTQVLRPLQRGETLSYPAFYVRRAWRILPAFFVVLALYSCFPAVREATGMQPWWQFATFTMNLLIDYSRNQAFSHAWSLCVEEHFYLIFPLLAVWLAKRPSASRFFIACAFIALSGVVLRGAVWIHDAALNPPRNWFIEDIYYPSWMRLDGLLVGVMLAFLRVYRTHQWSNLQARSGICLVAGLSVSTLSLWIFRDRTGLIANTIGWPLLSCGFGLFVVAASSTNGLLGRFRVPGAGWLAAISYSLYLSHKIAFHFVEGATDPTMQISGVLMFAIYAVSTLLLGSVLYYLVERPCLVWRDRRLNSTLAKPNSAL